MARRRTTPQQIAAALDCVRDGARVTDICRVLAISPRTFARWRSRHAAPDRITQLERENRRLKRRLADLAAQKSLLQRILRHRD